MCVCVDAHNYREHIYLHTPGKDVTTNLVKFVCVWTRTTTENTYIYREHT